MIREYNPHTDFPTLVSWYLKRGVPIPHVSYLPSTGWIMDEKAAMFMVKTDTAYAILEYYVASPDTTQEERRLMGTALVNHATDVAKKSGYKRVFSWVTHPGSEYVLESNNFNKSQVNFFTKDI